MHQFLRCSTLVFLCLAVSCGGGSSDGGVKSGSDLIAGFVPDQANPPDGSISLTPGTAGPASEMVTIRVALTEVTDVFGAALDVVYNGSAARFDSWSAGGALESGGHAVTYQISAVQPGRVVVGASRNGSTGGMDVSGTMTLVNLNFEVTRAGSSAVGLENASLLDAQSPPVEIPGLVFSGGTFTAE